MEISTSILIAKMFAVVYLMAGLGILINPGYYRKAIDEMLKNVSIFYLGGAMAAVAGILIVTYHNIWVANWTVVITIFGWLALLKGFMFLVFPKHIKLWQSMFKNKSYMPVWAIIILALGVFFGYYGFLV